MPCGDEDDLLILLVGSWRSVIFATAGRMYGAGTVNVSPKRWLNRCASVLRQLKVLPLVLADRHLVGLVQQDVGGLQDRVREQPDGRLVGAAACADLSLNWVIRFASPKPVMQPSTQLSSACSGTWLCTNRMHRSGSRPAAISWAAATRVRRRSAAGSYGTVIACRSTTQ